MFLRSSAQNAVVLIFLFGVLTMAPHATAQDQPVVPPMPGFIVFSLGDQMGWRDMMTGETLLLPGLSGDSISIHPRGHWLLFHGGPYVRVMDLATQQLLQIGQGSARWHPTEGWLTVDRRDGLFRMDLPTTLNFQPRPDVTVTQSQTASGTNMTTITRVYPTPEVPFAQQPYLPIANITDFTWRNDGQQLIVGRSQRRSDTPGSEQILYRLDLADCRRADGTLDAAVCEAALDPLTQGVYRVASSPAYSPDGRWLAFTAKRAPGTEENYFASRIVVLDLHTGAMHQVTTPVRYNQSVDGSRYEIIQDFTTVWGPDGRTLLFTRGATTQDGFVGLLLHNLDTGEEIVLPAIENMRPGGLVDWWWPGKYAPIAPR